jgi:N-methylhydantoinase B
MSLFAGSIDPVTFEILSHRLHQITREMGIALERTGGTVNTTQQRDYMTSLYRPNGEILSAGETMGHHVVCAGYAVKRIIDRFEADEIYPDDIFLLNDPYLAAIHQSDIYVVSPIHHHERLVGWSATFVHVNDVGALSPGGDSPDATEIFHEGLRIPGLKLVERGKLRKDVFDTLTNMTRQPGMVGLDLKCEIAANNVAKSRMHEMYAHYGPELLDAVSSEMIRYSETVLRKRIAEIPDGCWSENFTIETGEKFRMKITLRKERDRLVFDFTGTDTQARKGINLPYHATFGFCFAALTSSLAYDLPKNHGVLRPVEVIAPKGTLVNVAYPGPVSLSTTSCGFAVAFLAGSVLMQMLGTSEKWKKEIVAPTASHRNGKHSGINQYGRYCVFNLAHGAMDGNGARTYQDGVDSGGSYMSCPNVEWFELNFPILYLFRRHAIDSAGAGRFRGGVGVETAHTVHDAPEKKLQGVAYGVAGLKNSGRGLFGGHPGAPSVIVLRQGTRLREIVGERKSPVDVVELGGAAQFLSYCNFELDANDVLYMRVASGGGYADPLEREPERVRQDVANGIVSRQAAREIYGVVFDVAGSDIDLAATQSLRSRLRAEGLE